jgi:hypothetical protein
MILFSFDAVVVELRAFRNLPFRRETLVIIRRQLRVIVTWPAVPCANYNGHRVATGKKHWVNTEQFNVRNSAANNEAQDVLKPPRTIIAMPLS